MRNYICRLYLEAKEKHQAGILTLSELGAWDEIETIYHNMTQLKTFNLNNYLDQNIHRLLRHEEKITDYGQGALDLLFHLKEKATQN